MKVKLFFLYLLFIICERSLAGGWVVGGGEILGDAVNPWFLNDNPVVRYCIKVDDANFGLNRNRIEQIVVRGLGFWTRQFSESLRFDKDFPVGKQIFLKEDCQSSTDLKFQFGVLDPDQIQKLQDLDRKIAVSVRTDYDKVAMRGKGFIYIAPEQGTLALSGPRVEKKPWSLSKGLLTELVLLHELGHVFGMRHDSKIPLMQEDFVEFVVTPGVLDYLKDQDIEKGIDEMKLFQISKSFTYPAISACFSEISKQINKSTRNSISNNVKEQLSTNSIWSHGQMLADFFGLEFIPNCYSSLTTSSNEYHSAQLLFYDQNKQKISVSLGVSKNEVARVDRESLLKIYLPNEQRVFKNSYNEFYLYFGTFEKSVSFYSKIYIPKNGKTRTVAVTLFSDRNPIISGVIDGKLYLDMLGGW